MLVGAKGGPGGGGEGATIPRRAEDRSTREVWARRSCIAAPEPLEGIGRPRRRIAGISGGIREVGDEEFPWVTGPRISFNRRASRELASSDSSERAPLRPAVLPSSPLLTRPRQSEPVIAPHSLDPPGQTWAIGEHQADARVGRVARPGRQRDDCS